MFRNPLLQIRVQYLSPDYSPFDEEIQRVVHGGATDWDGPIVQTGIQGIRVKMTFGRIDGIEHRHTLRGPALIAGLQKIREQPVDFLELIGGREGHDGEPSTATVS